MAAVFLHVGCAHGMVRGVSATCEALAAEELLTDQSGHVVNGRLMDGKSDGRE